MTLATCLLLLPFSSLPHDGIDDVLARERDTSAPFRAVVVVDGRAGTEWDYPAYTDLADDWLDRWSPYLDVTEVVLVEDLPESSFESSPRRGYDVYAVVVDPAAWPEEWAPGGAGRIWLVGPEGVALGDYALDDIASAGARLAQCLPGWIGKEPAEIWDEIVASETCWRHVVTAIHEGSLRLAGYVDLPADWRALAGTAPDAPGTALAEVRLAGLCLLAVQQDAELPEDALRTLRECALFEESDALYLADLFYRLHAGDVAAEAFQGELLPRRKGDQLARLKALYQLRLRHPLLVAPLHRLVERASSRAWEERSLALRILAEQVEPGVSIEPPAVLPAEVLPRERDVQKEDSWRVRLAHADALVAFGSRVAVERLIGRLGVEEHERVLDGIERALERLSGRSFGRDVATWNRWYESLGEDWIPTLELPGGWSPPASPRQGANQRTRALAVGDEGLFGTDVRHVVFAVDVSGSMRDGLAREVEKDLKLQFGRMDAGLRVGLVLFNDRARSVHDKSRNPALVPADPGTARTLVRSYTNASKSGRTDLAAGIREAFRYEDAEEIILVTDAFPTAGDPQSVPGLVQLVDDLNLTRRARISTVLMRVGKDYYTEDLGSRRLPEPTPEQRLEWAQRAELYAANADFSLLHELSRYNDGRCRVGFGNQIWSRNGVPTSDR